MSEDYYLKQERRIQRYKDLAEKKQAESEQTLDQAHKMADVIPFGQPILVGHYSEGRDRNYRARIEGKFAKAFELNNTAKYYRDRASSAEKNNAISSDAPDAIELLREKLAGLKESHAMMVQGNKIIRSKKLTNEQKIPELAKIGISKGRAELLLSGENKYEIGFQPFELSNSSANIKRIEERIKQLEKAANDETKEYEAGDARIVDSVEDNRVMVFFPGIPAEDVRAYLKSQGFRWSPTNGCWQAFRTSAWKIPCIIKRLSPLHECQEAPQ